MPGLIPRNWCDAVVRILQSGDRRHIRWTGTALQRWNADTNGAWEYEAREAIIAALEVDGIEGNQTTSFADQLAAYEFLFPFRNMLMYGKIALNDDGVSILILSAHKAQRPTLGL